MPVLGVGGRANAGAFVAKALEDVAETVMSAVIDGAGHWVSDENPAELSRVLLEFFDAL
jgi:pimeloyl-ACP methyl ester carboxylesterase